MNKTVLFLLLSGLLAVGIKPALAVTDLCANIIDVAAEYVDNAGQVQEGINEQVNEYMQMKVGIPGDMKAIDKAQAKAERAQAKLEKQQEKYERMQAKIEQAKEKAAGMQEEMDKQKGKLDKAKDLYAKAQEKVAKAKEFKEKAEAKVAEVKSEVDKAKSQYEDIKGQIDEAKQGVNDLKDSASALKDVAAAKLDEAKEKAGVEKEAPQDEMPQLAAAEAYAATENEDALQAPEGTEVPLADKLSAINNALPAPAEVANLEAAAVVELPAAVELSPEEILASAAEVDLQAPEKTEHVSQYDLKQQLQMLDAAKAKALAEAPQNISAAELNAQLRVEDEAKLESLRATRKGGARKEFTREMPIAKGEKNAQ